jgi:hypothetical protein
MASMVAKNENGVKERKMSKWRQSASAVSNQPAMA